MNNLIPRVHFDMTHRTAEQQVRYIAQPETSTVLPLLVCDLLLLIYY